MHFFLRGYIVSHYIVFFIQLLNCIYCIDLLFLNNKFELCSLPLKTYVYPSTNSYTRTDPDCNLAEKDHIIQRWNTSQFANFLCKMVCVFTEI